MTNKIHNAFDKIEATEELKSSTMQFLRAEREKRTPCQTRTVWMKVLVPVCVIVIFFVGLGGYHTMKTPVSYVSIDVNPSVELALNRYDRVISSTAYNEEGESVLEGINVKGKLYTEAIDTIVESPAMQPYLTEDAELTFTVATSDSAKESSLITGLKHCSGGRKHGGQSHRAEFSSVSEAHDHDLSFGKYAAYLELSQYDSSVTAADCHDMTMAEIHSRINEHANENRHNGNGVENKNTENGHGHKRNHE